MDQLGSNNCFHQIKTYLFCNLYKFARVTLQLALLCIFFWFFGLPAITKYQEETVVVVESLRPTDGIPSPTVTIFANNDDLNGVHQGTYKNGGFEQVCSNLKRNNTIDDCIDKNSNEKSDFLVDILLGYKRPRSLMSVQNVNDEFTRPLYGRYHSLDFTFQICSRKQDQIFFILSNKFT